MNDSTLDEVRAVRKAGENERLREVAQREAMGKALFRYTFRLLADVAEVAWATVGTPVRVDFCDKAAELYAVLSAAREVEVEPAPDSR